VPDWDARWGALHLLHHEAPGHRRLGVIVFFLQIATLTKKISNNDKYLQNRGSPTSCAFGAD